MMLQTPPTSPSGGHGKANNINNSNNASGGINRGLSGAWRWLNMMGPRIASHVEAKKQKRREKESPATTSAASTASMFSSPPHQQPQQQHQQPHASNNIMIADSNNNAGYGNGHYGLSKSLPQRFAFLSPRKNLQRGPITEIRPPSRTHSEKENHLQSVEHAPSAHPNSSSPRSPAPPKLNLAPALAVAPAPDEAALRKEKFAKFEHDCTMIEDFLFISGEKVAQNKELLCSVGITHILNATASTTPCCFPKLFCYKPLYIEDIPGQDLTCHFYHAIEFIEKVKNTPGGKILIHCTQGVSRSVSLALSYYMASKQMSFEDALVFVKSRRGIASPNTGFSCQLMVWAKRLNGEYGTGLPIVYSVQPYTNPALDPTLVPHIITNISQALASKCLIIASTNGLLVWSKENCDEDHHNAARCHCQHLSQYEHAPDPLYLSANMPHAQLLPFILAIRQAFPAITQTSNEEIVKMFTEDNALASSGSSFLSAVQASNGQPDMNPVPPTPRGKPAARTDNKSCGDNKLGTIDDDDDNNDDNCKAFQAPAKMYAYPDWEELDNFDSDDLWDDKAYVLYVDPEHGEESIYIWMGEKFQANLSQEEADTFATHCISSFTKCMNLNITAVPIIEHQGEESDNFWDLFQLG